MIVRVLEKTGATLWACGTTYKAVDQLVLLYFSVSWLVTGAMIKVLEGFRQCKSRRITRMMATRRAGGGGEYTPVVAALESMGLHPIMEYIRRRRATISENVA